MPAPLKRYVVVHKEEWQLRSLAQPAHDLLAFLLRKIEEIELVSKPGQSQQRWNLVCKMCCQRWHEGVHHGDARLRLELSLALGDGLQPCAPFAEERIEVSMALDVDFHQTLLTGYPLNLREEGMLFAVVMSA